MRSKSEILAVATILFFHCASSLGQQPASASSCKVSFAVYQSNPHIPGGIAPGMSKEQRKWYEQNKKKFSAVCLDSDKPDYIVIWSSRFASAGSPETTINFAAINGQAGTSPVAASGYEVSSPMESEYVYMSIFRAADVNRARTDKTYQPMPVFYVQQDSWWTYRKSHRKAIESALKFLSERSNR